jgi:hypothetical protein
MNDGALTRRDFLRRTGAVAFAAGAGIPLFDPQEARGRARVILIRHERAVSSGGAVAGNVLEEMLDRSVTQLFERDTVDEAWKTIAMPGDVFGIKTNVWRSLRTPVELEQALVERLVKAGVAREEIAIDDRGVRSNPVFQRATGLVNVRPLRAHHWSGVGGLLKNYIMFTASPPDYHADSCIDLGAIWNYPAVKGKTRLNVLVMLTPQFHCLGPHHFDREFTWPYGGMLVGTDPVAVDAVGLKILEAKRRQYFKEESPMRPPVRHIAAAETRHGIGVADLRRIDIVKLGWKEGTLI